MVTSRITMGDMVVAILVVTSKIIIEDMVVAILVVTSGITIGDMVVAILVVTSKITIGDMVVAILVVTSGNIMRIENVVRGHIGMRYMIGGHLEGWVGDWLEEAWMDVLEIKGRETGKDTCIMGGNMEGCIRNI